MKRHSGLSICRLTPPGIACQDAPDKAKAFLHKRSACGGWEDLTASGFWCANSGVLCLFCGLRSTCALVEAEGIVRRGVMEIKIHPRGAVEKGAEGIGVTVHRTARDTQMVTFRTWSGRTDVAHRI